MTKYVFTRTGYCVHLPKKKGSNLTKCGRWHLGDLLGFGDVSDLLDRGLMCSHCGNQEIH